MAKDPTWLLEFKRDVYSQIGEDGIIEKILQIMAESDQWCVEFGAWDGEHLSNTRYLIESKSFSSVLIEANPEKFKELQENNAKYENVIAFNQFVGFQDDDNLDRILSQTPIPENFDFLSIDIDGNDYHVWDAMSKYRPKLIAIEFNPTIPTPVRFVQPADSSVSQGASLLSLVELGKEKGYELVSVLPWNAFFVRKEFYPLFELESNAPEQLRVDTNHITYLFSGYDGELILHGARRLPWHQLEIEQSQVQVLPRFLRRYPYNYSTLQRLAFNGFLFLKNPMKYLKNRA